MVTISCPDFADQIAIALESAMFAGWVFYAIPAMVGICLGWFMRACNERTA